MAWNSNLPDVESWQPSVEKREPLRSALMLTCQIAQARIVSRADDEIKFNLHNFDSGLGVEDIVREELGALLPGRYFASPGVISDARGHTAGECDLVVRDHIWSPVIKPQATGTSRRVHLPIESIYAATEIKQSLGFAELDDAMKKLVTISGLERRDNPYGHITENQHLPWLDKQGNDPQSTSHDGFGDQTAGHHGLRRHRATLRRNQLPTQSRPDGHNVVRDWSRNRVVLGRERRPDERHIHAGPGTTAHIADGSSRAENAFYRYIILLMGHLNRSVLGLNEVWHAYGEPPPTRDTFVYPDAEFNRNATA